MVDLELLHPALRGPIQVRSKHVGLERPRDLLAALPEEPERLLQLANRHVVSALQFDRDLVRNMVVNLLTAPDERRRSDIAQVLGAVLCFSKQVRCPDR